MSRDNLDVAHFTASYGFGPQGVPTIITLQDEINLLPLADIIRSHAKNPRTIAMMSYLHYSTHAALRGADALITVSEYSKRQIVAYSSLDPNKIVPIPHGCPQDIHRIDSAAELDDVRQRLAIKRGFILAEAFKNPAVIVRAWRRLPDEVRQANEIIFFSRSADVLPVVYEAISAGYARLLVRPARHDLSALFSMAQAFVFPSWIEGFGIPLLEAMTCGAPVLASDRGSIPEVTGDAALLCDAEDDATLAQHITHVIDSSTEARRLRECGFARAAQFSWQHAAELTLKSYGRIARAQAPNPSMSIRSH
jgi:glycosyltransferase involved in cell wall biosynthesis